MDLSISQMVERDRPYHDEKRKDKPLAFFGYYPFVATDEPFREDGFLDEPSENRANVPAYLYPHTVRAFEYACGFGVDFFFFLSMDCRCTLTKIPEGWGLAI